jgi:hypothetical protein
MKRCLKNTAFSQAALAGEKSQLRFSDGIADKFHAQT